MSRRIILFGLVLAWMALIFWFSSAGHEVSSGQSTEAVRVLHQTIGVVLPEMTVRKAAHVALYLVLGGLLVLLVRTYNVRWSKAVMIAVAIACVYAISDEVHQLLVGGRSGQVSDMALDTVAAAVGALIVRCGYHLDALRKRQ